MAQPPVFAIYYILSGLAQTWVEQGSYRQSTGRLVALRLDVHGCVQLAVTWFLAEAIPAPMTIINHYLAIQVLMGLGIATAVLLPLFSFLDLLDQLDDVGKGTYRVEDAFLHTALLLPRRFVQLAPFIALLGNVIALGRLAVNSELTALRVAGFPPPYQPCSTWSWVDPFIHCGTGTICRAPTSAEGYFVPRRCA